MLRIIYTDPSPRVLGLAPVSIGDEVSVPTDTAERLISAGVAVAKPAPKPKSKAGGAGTKES